MKKCNYLGYSFSLFLSLIITVSYAQLDHIRYQLPDSLLNDQPFAQLDTSSFLTTGVLWDRAIPNLDFLAYQGYNDGDTAQGLDAFQAYAVLKGRGKVHNASELVFFSIFANIANRPTHFCEKRIIFSKTFPFLPISQTALFIFAKSA